MNRLLALALLAFGASAPQTAAAPEVFDGTLAVTNVTVVSTTAIETVLVVGRVVPKNAVMK